MGKEVVDNQMLFTCVGLSLGPPPPPTWRLGQLLSVSGGRGDTCLFKKRFPSGYLLGTCGLFEGENVHYPSSYPSASVASHGELIPTVLKHTIPMFAHTWVFASALAAVWCAYLLLSAWPVLFSLQVSLQTGQLPLGIFALLPQAELVAPFSLPPMHPSTWQPSTHPSIHPLIFTEHQ